MTGKNATQRALITSVLAMVMCTAMLIGTTFAWFTDTASTAVNKIQAGTLDIELQYATAWNAEGVPTAWDNAEGKMLNFRKAAGAPANEAILWEPGCTYQLPHLRVVNKGDLALKYEIVISGIAGDARLNEVIEWEWTGYNTTDQGYSPARGDALTAGHRISGTILPGTELDTLEHIVISGHMLEDASNEYQGLSIDGIGITVVATQYTHENDSNGDQYDKDAVYPVIAPVLNYTDSAEFASDSANAITIENKDVTSVIPANSAIYENADDATPISATANDGELQRVLKTSSYSADSVTYDISYQYVSGTTSTDVHKFGNVVENVIKLSTGLKSVKVTHSGESMTLAADTTAKADGTYYYDAETGKLTIWSSSYSPFEITYESDFVATVDGRGYPTLKEAIAAAHKSPTDLTVTLLKDVTLTSDLQLGTGNHGLTLNLNGKTIDGGTSYQVFTAGEGTINFTGGTIKNNMSGKGANYAALYVLSGNTATLDDVTIEGNYAAIANYGKMTITKANLVGQEFGVGCFGSSSTVFGTENGDNSGIFVTAKYQAIATAVTYSYASDVTVYGGSYTTTGTNWDEDPIYWAGAGTLTVYDGIFKNETAGTGAAAVFQKNGTVKILGGTFTSRDGIKIEHQSDSTGIKTNITGGTFTGVRSGLYVKSLKSNDLVTVADGTSGAPVFTGGADKNALYDSGVAAGTVVFTGGVFDGETSSAMAPYIAAGYTFDETTCTVTAQ